MSYLSLGTIPEANTSSNETGDYSLSDKDEDFEGASEYSDDSASVRLSEDEETYTDSSVRSYSEDESDVSVHRSFTSRLTPFDNKSEFNEPRTSVQKRPMSTVKGIRPTNDHPLAFHSSLMKNENRSGPYLQRMFSPVDLESPKKNRSSLSSRSDIRSEREHFTSEDMKPIFQDIPSPISRNIDELVDAEKRQYEQAVLTHTERQEYQRLEVERRENELTIRQLRSEVNQLFYEYCDMQKQQTEELRMMEGMEQEYIQNLQVSELSQMRKEFCNQFEKRQRDILNQIEDKYEKPVNRMYSNTQAIARNMSRSLLGRIVFAVVWLMEFVWNWCKTEWARVSTMQHAQDDIAIDRVTSSKGKQGSKRRKGTRKSNRKR